MLYQKRVRGRNVGMNPVARAIARQKLTASIRDQKIQLYLMDSGEPCKELMDGIGVSLSILGAASELDARIGPDDVKVRILRGGLSVCWQLSETDQWDPAQVRAIDVALDAAVDLNSRVHPECINEAVHALSKCGNSDTQRKNIFA